MANPLNALADVAANLFISLPDSPQGKPFIDRAECDSPAALLRAMRKRLNLTQREFGMLLAPSGGSAISPSVICQLESALQTVPPPLVARAVAATTAAQKLGEHLSAQPASKAGDAVGALKALGPGCIDELQPYLDATAGKLTDDEAALVKDFLSIVTKRRHSTGGSRPGARGPYRKLAKVTAKHFPAQGGAAAAPAPAAAEASATAAGGELQPTCATSGAVVLLGAGAGAAAGEPSEAACASGLLALTQSEAAAPSPAASGRTTPNGETTPSSSRGSSRPRSPNASVSMEGDGKSPRGNRDLSPRHSLSGRDSGRDSLSSSIASSPAFTPGGSVRDLGTPTAFTPGGSVLDGEGNLEVLMALRRLQEENEALQQENRRLRQGGTQPETPIARADVTMSC